MNKKDLMLQQLLPTVMMPLHEPLDRPEAPCDRIVIAANGTFLEVIRKWGYFVRRIGNINYRLPYGNFHNITQLNVPKVPRELFAGFKQYAVANCRREVGASIIWNEFTNAYRLQQLDAIASSADELVYAHARLDEGEHVIVDCHSHARGKAFFSAIDDADDSNHVNFALVYGHCDQANQSSAMRLSIYGIFDNFTLEDL